MKPLLPFCRRVAVPEQRCSQHPAGTAAPRAPLPAPCQQLFSKTQTCFAMRPHPQPPSTASACLLPPSRHPLLCLWEGGVVRAVQSPLCNPTVARRATHFRNFPLFAATLPRPPSSLTRRAPAGRSASPSPASRPRPSAARPPAPSPSCPSRQRSARPGATSSSSSSSSSSGNAHGGGARSVLHDACTQRTASGCTTRAAGDAYQNHPSRRHAVDAPCRTHGVQPGHDTHPKGE